MKAKRRQLTVLGCSVWVDILAVTDGYECRFAPDGNRGDTRRDLITSGHGDTEAAAIEDYVRDCHAREQLPPGHLYAHDSAMMQEEKRAGA